MRTLLSKIFLVHWQRKALSCILGIVIWLAVNHSLTVTKTIGNIPVRIINVPAGRTVEGLQTNGLLSKRIVLTLVGNNSLLNDLSPNDLEVVIDAADKPEEWVVSLSKKNLVSLNSDIHLSKGIQRLSHPTFQIHMTNLVTEKIPVLVTEPIGSPPRDYQLLEVWPYRLTLNVSGPEEMINQLKAKGLKLTFNLSDIKKSQLDALSATRESSQGDVISFYVPNQWKQVVLPLLSDTPIEINDPQASALRIDFVRNNLLAIEKPIPISFFISPECSNSLSTESLKVHSAPFLQKRGGSFFVNAPLFAKGVSPAFLKAVEGRLEIVVVVKPKNEKETLDWSVQFIHPKLLEDRYVSMLLSDTNDEEIRDLMPALREEYLRNRFRSYMNRFQLYLSDEIHFDLKAELHGQTVHLDQKPHSSLAHVETE